MTAATDGAETAKVRGAEALICLPTYNEAGNLANVLEAIFRLLPSSHVLVIDDDSPDGTGELAERMRREDERIFVLHRPRKEGLGRAYLAGFAQAVGMSDAARIVQMDADLSHPPTRLPTLLRASAEADLVIGSRYIDAGGIRNWGVHRRMLSRFGCLYARWWTGLPVRDLTGGFKVWRRELLRQVLHEPIRSDGYAFQVETTFLAHRLGARIREVPILFADRAVDASKMTFGVALEAFWKVPQFRWRHGRVRPSADAGGEG